MSIPAIVPAIVLAGGASRRLGQPKQLVRVGTETLLARTLRTARESGAAPVFAVLGANADAIAPTLSQTEIVVNPDWEQGIATSIRAGMGAILAANAGAAMILVCDQPQLTADHLRALIAAHRQSPQSIVASQYAGIRGIPAIFPASQFPNLLALEGDTGAKILLRRPECPLISIAFEGGAQDIDTPVDLDSLQSAIL